MGKANGATSSKKGRNCPLYKCYILGRDAVSSIRICKPPEGNVSVKGLLTVRRKRKVTTEKYESFPI